MSNVTLREITKENYLSIINMEVADEQSGFVASNAKSMVQAQFYPEAWYRGIFDGDEAVGFVMLSMKPEEKEYWVWRLMVGKDYQRKGYGRTAMQLVIDFVRTQPGAETLFLSHVEPNTAAGAFYSSLGFKYTGKKDEDGEVEMALTLGPR